MKSLDVIREGVNGVKANRGRSLLTILGIVVGISAVVTMTALVGGVKQTLVGELGLSQARLINVWCNYSRAMNADDVESIHEDLAASVQYSAPLALHYTTVVWGGDSKSCQCQGVTQSFFDTLNMNCLEGSLITEEDLTQLNMVAVLDKSGCESLFGDVDYGQLIGREIEVDGNSFTLIGIADGQGLSNVSTDINVYMPISTYSQRISGNTTIDQFYLLANEGVAVDRLVDDVKTWLIDRYNIPDNKIEDSIDIITMESVIDEMNATMTVFELIMVAVASISLLVGGIGIMNMMLTSVSERVKEIGLRKAIGARKADITKQFLIEAIALTLLGGIAGLVLGLFGAHALSGMAGSALFGNGNLEIEPHFEIQTIFETALTCIIIGIVSGGYPAWKAANLKPVEALSRS